MRIRVPSLALLSGLKIWHCCELWCRLAAAALIRPLAQEFSYATGAALRRKGKEGRKGKERGEEGRGRKGRREEGRKRNEVLIHRCYGKNLENTMLSERSQSQKTTYYMIPFTRNVQREFPHGPTG